MRKLAVNLHSCVNASAQYAGLAALKGPQDEEAVKMVAEFDQRRKVVVEGLNRLPGVSCATPKGAFYAFPNVKHTGWKAKALASSLLEDGGVAIIGGPDFGILGEGYVRLSYANSTENILKALDRMGEFLVAESGLKRRMASATGAHPIKSGDCAGTCASDSEEEVMLDIASPRALRGATHDAAELPRLRRRRGDPVHPRQLAARMEHGAGGAAAAGNPRRRP